jgi:hypothetical protein
MSSSSARETTTTRQHAAGSLGNGQGLQRGGHAGIYRAGGVWWGEDRGGVAAVDLSRREERYFARAFGKRWNEVVTRGGGNLVWKFPENWAGKWSGKLKIRSKSWFVRMSPVLSSKFHTLKEYFLSFITRTLFYSTTFFNHLCYSYSKFILYINYHPYFIIFPTNNFFSVIPISTNILFLFLILIPRSASQTASQTKIFR